MVLSAREQQSLRRANLPWERPGGEGRGQRERAGAWARRGGMGKRGSEGAAPDGQEERGGASARAQGDGRVWTGRPWAARPVAVDADADAPRPFDSLCTPLSRCPTPANGPSTTASVTGDPARANERTTDERQRTGQGRTHDDAVPADRDAVSDLGGLDDRAGADRDVVADLDWVVVEGPFGGRGEGGGVSGGEKGGWRAGGRGEGSGGEWELGHGLALVERAGGRR